MHKMRKKRIHRKGMQLLMNGVQSFFSQLFAQLSQIGITDLLDILVVGFLIYKILPMLRSTGTMRIAKIVGIVLLITWLTGVLKMHTLNFLLSHVLEVGLIAVVILFQPELRRMIDHLGNMNIRGLFGNKGQNEEILAVIDQTVEACENMSQNRVGALIVFARQNRLDEYFKTGSIIDGQVSEQLILNIFFPKAALHDGAMIIRDGRVIAAACVLPLSDSDRLSADLGTRHRAGVGISEVTDSVVVIVSEETGAISVAVGGVLKRHLAPQTLKRLLRNELCSADAPQEENFALKLYQKLSKRDKEDGFNEK